MAKALIINEDVKIPGDELRYRFSRSSGPGGQNVNKVESKVELLFDIDSSVALDDVQKRRLHVVAASKIDAEGTLVLRSQASRSRQENIELVRNQLLDLIKRSLREPKKRVKTAISAGAKHGRRTAKKKSSQKKQTRSASRSALQEYYDAEE